MFDERMRGDKGSEVENYTMPEPKNLDNETVSADQKRLLELWKAEQESIHFLEGRSLQEARDELTSLRESSKLKPGMYTRIFHSGDIKTDFSKIASDIKHLTSLVNVAGQTHSAYETNAAKYFLNHKEELEAKGISFESFKANPTEYLDEEPKSFTQSA